MWAKLIESSTTYIDAPIDISPFDANNDRLISSEEFGKLIEYSKWIDQGRFFKLFFEKFEKNEWLKTWLWEVMIAYFKSQNWNDSTVSNELYELYCRVFKISRIDLLNLINTDNWMISNEGIDIPIDVLRNAIKEWSKFVSDFMGNKSKWLSSKWALGPTFDFSYLSRIGKSTNGVYSDANWVDGYWHDLSWLIASKSRLTKIGIPELNPDLNKLISQSWSNELYLSNLLNYLAKIEVRPETKFVLKHWPGWTDETEVTERNWVHYDSKEYIKKQLSLFQAVINSKNPPRWIMLSHASYDMANFDAIDKLSKIGIDDSLEWIDISKIPASLNPVLVRYLRENMWYKGAILWDWYDMWAIKEFTKNVKLTFSENNQINSEYVAFYLAINAWVNFVGWLTPQTIWNSTIWKNFEKKYPEKFNNFKKQLDKIFLESFKLLNIKWISEDETNKLSFEDKVCLLAINTKQPSIQNQLRARINDSNRKVYELFMIEWPWDYDIWNRSTVLVLLLRQKIIENISWKKININPPLNINDEELWKNNLLSNPVFKEYHNKINWNSPQIQKLLEEQMQSKLQWIQK